MPTELKHFVAYNNSGDPQWCGYKPAAPGERDHHWTRRKYHPETLKGNVLWVIEGLADNQDKRYELRVQGTIEGIEATKEKEPPWRQISFRVTKNLDTDLTCKPWLPRLLTKTGNFGLGLCPISDPEVLAGLQAISRTK